MFNRPNSIMKCVKQCSDSVLLALAIAMVFAALTTQAQAEDAAIKVTSVSFLQNGSVVDTRNGEQLSGVIDLDVQVNFITNQADFATARLDAWLSVSTPTIASTSFTLLKPSALLTIPTSVDSSTDNSYTATIPSDLLASDLTWVLSWVDHSTNSNPSASHLIKAPVFTPTIFSTPPKKEDVLTLSSAGAVTVGNLMDGSPGTGDAVLSDSCPAGEVVTSMAVRFDGGTIKPFHFTCAPFRWDGTAGPQDGTTVYVTSPFANLPFDAQYQTVSCPSGLLTGLRGMTDTTNVYTMGHFCSRSSQILDGSADLSMGIPIGDPSVVGLGTPSEINCPAGHVMTGVDTYTNANDEITGVYVQCTDVLVNGVTDGSSELQLTFQPDYDSVSIDVNELFVFPEATCVGPDGSSFYAQMTGPIVDTSEPGTFTKTFTCEEDGYSAVSRNFTVMVSQPDSASAQTASDFDVMFVHKTDPFYNDFNATIDKLSKAEKLIQTTNWHEKITPEITVDVINYKNDKTGDTNFNDIGPGFSYKLFPEGHDSGNVTENFTFDEHYAGNITGKFEVPVAGTYVFGVRSDDGFRLTIDGQEVMEPRTGHGPPEDFFGDIPLAAGVHDLTLVYFQKDKGAIIGLFGAQGNKIEGAGFSSYPSMSLLSKDSLSKGIALEPVTGGSVPLSFSGAKQIDTRDDDIAQAGAENAIDGNTNGEWFEPESSYTNSVTHTKPSNNAWWQGDLGSSVPVGAVTLYNRVGCCPDRLSDFYLIVSDSDIEGLSLEQALAGANYAVHQTSPIPSANNANNSMTYVLPNGITGQYVGVYKVGEGPLSLAEVVAFEASPNLDKTKPNIIFDPDKDSVFVPVGGDYDLPSVSCNDSVDPNPVLLPNPEGITKVSTSTVGEFPYNYTCTDAAGNTTQRQFTVNVVGDWMYTVEMVSADTENGCEFAGDGGAGTCIIGGDVLSVDAANMLLRETRDNFVGPNNRPELDLVPSINYSINDGTDRGGFGSDNGYPLSHDERGGRNFAMRATTQFTLFYSGYYMFKLRASSGARLLIDNDIVISDNNDAPTDPATNIYQVKFLEAGPHDLEIIYYNQNNSSAELELSVAQASGPSMRDAPTLVYELMTADAYAFDINNRPPGDFDTSSKYENGILSDQCDSNSVDDIECIKSEIARRNALMLSSLCPTGLDSCPIGREYGALVDIPNLEADVEYGGGIIEDLLTVTGLAPIAPYWRVWTGVGASIEEHPAQCIVPSPSILNDGWSWDGISKSCFEKRVITVDGETKNVDAIVPNILIEVGQQDSKNIELFGKDPKFQYSIWNFDNYRNVNWDYSGMMPDPDLAERPILNQTKPVLLPPELFERETIDEGVYKALDASNVGCWDTKTEFLLSYEPNTVDTWGCTFKIAVGESDDSDVEGNRVVGHKPVSKFSIYDVSNDLGLNQPLHVGLSRCRVPSVAQAWEPFINLTSAAVPSVNDFKFDYYCDMDFVDFEQVGMALAQDEIDRAERVQLIFDVTSTLVSLGASGGISSVKAATKSKKLFDAMKRLKKAHDAYEYTLGLTTLFAEAYVFSTETVQECNEMSDPVMKRKCFAGAVAGLALALATTDLALDEAADAAHTVLKGVDGNVVPNLDKDDIADIIRDTRASYDINSNLHLEFWTDNDVDLKGLIQSLKDQGSDDVANRLNDVLIATADNTDMNAIQVFKGGVRDKTQRILNGEALDPEDLILYIKNWDSYTTKLVSDPDGIDLSALESESSIFEQLEIRANNFDDTDSSEWIDQFKENYNWKPTTQEEIRARIADDDSQTCSI